MDIEHHKSINIFERKKKVRERKTVKIEAFSPRYEMRNFLSRRRERQTERHTEREREREPER